MLSVREYIYIAVVSVVLLLCGAVWYYSTIAENYKAQLVAMQAAQEVYKAKQAEVIADVETQHKKKLSDIERRYTDVTKRLQQYQSYLLPAADFTGFSKGNESTDTGELQAVLLGKLAEISKYADELRLAGENCETILQQ